MQIDKPYRVSHRLRGFDYSLPGAYYVTICTCQKRCLFGIVQAGKMQLNHEFRARKQLGATLACRAGEPPAIILRILVTCG